MKKLLVILILIFTIFNVYSQDVGTTITEKKSTVFDIQRNSLFVAYHFLTLSAFYERTIPIKNKVGLLVGGGIMQGVAFTDATNPVVKFGCVLGGYKHFFESGVIIAPLRDDIDMLLPMVGYRYQHPKGFLLRVDVVLIVDSGTAKDGSGEEWVEAYPIPGITLGYSF